MGKNTKNIGELARRRSEIADKFFMECTLPNHMEVDERDGFEYSSGDDEYTCVAYLLSDEGSSTKTNVRITFECDSVAISEATIAGLKIEIPAKYAVSTMSKADKENIRVQAVESLESLERLGKMLDIGVEDGNYHSETYAKLAKLINTAIQSVEAIKEEHL